MAELGGLDECGDKADDFRFVVFAKFTRDHEDAFWVGVCDVCGCGGAPAGAGEDGLSIPRIWGAEAIDVPCSEVAGHEEGWQGDDFKLSVMVDFVAGEPCGEEGEVG